MEAIMSDSWDVTIKPVDGLNPGFGYEIIVERNGVKMLSTASHPVTRALR
jgi:hypothetical protein